MRVVNDERLQDGMDNVWDKKVVASYIREEVKTRKVEAILTFDNYGVSGHVNHRACYGVKEVLCRRVQVPTCPHFLLNR